MNPFAGRRRDADGRNRRRSACPSLESLEGRLLLATSNGGQWTYGSRITYSFMPDGTSIGGIASNLYQTFNAVTTTATWQATIEKAAAIWQQVANINLALVPDDGSPMGTAGYQQGDPRFGDIRIGAYDQSTSTSLGPLAFALAPPPINGGTDASDIVFNSKPAWKINNDYDLLTVAIHELGHALGMGHSAVTQADMYAYYTGMKQSLNSDDVTGIQTIYGGVPADPTGNTTLATAIDLTPQINGLSQVVLGGQYVTAVTDYEWYKVTVPSTTTGTMVVKMQTSNLSSLSPRVAVYNSNQAALGQAIAANVYGATVSFTVSNVSPGQVYYIRASAGNTGPGSNGAFGLAINFGSSALPAIAPPNTTVASQPDQGGGSFLERTRGHRHRHDPSVAAPHQDAHQDRPIVVKLARRTGAVGDALTVAHPRPPRLRVHDHARRHA